MKKQLDQKVSRPVSRLRLSLIWTGFLFGLFYWIMESVRDVIGFEKGSFLGCMFHPDMLTFWMRVLGVSLVIGFGVLADSLNTRITRKPVKPLRWFQMGGMIWAGFGFSFLYWTIEAFRSHWTLSKGPFVQCLFSPDPVDTWARLMAVFVIVLFSAYAQNLINERRILELTLKETQENLEHLVQERTRALSESNVRLKEEILERIRTENELLKVNRALKILSACNETLVRVTDEQALFDEITRTLKDIGGSSLVWIDCVKQNGKCRFEPRSISSSADEDIEIRTWFHETGKDDGMPNHKAVQTLEPVFTDDLSSLPLDSGRIETIQNRGYRSLICMPLIDEGKAIGVIHLLNSRENPLDDQEIRLLKELATDMAFGIAILKTRMEKECAQREKEEMQSRLSQSQKMEAIGVLAGGVAHDFNNLLTAIQVSTDLAIMEVEEDSEVYKELNEIHVVADQAADLASQLLMSSRKHPIAPNTLDLNGVVCHLKKMWGRVLGENIAIHDELASGLWNIHADRGTIEQVIMNLIVNAREAMPEGGDLFIRTENAHLTKAKCRNITGSKPGKFVRLSVEDTGIGMPPEILGRIFEPFFTTKSPGNRTGLGLSVVYGIIQEHDGFVGVRSAPGVGTLFEIYLPAIYVKAELEEQKRIPFERYQGHGKCVLFIEDEEKVREYTSKGLQMNGYEVYTAANGSEAERMFSRESSHIDIVFSDVILPDTNGVDLSERLKKKKAGLKILLSSGYVEEQSRSEFPSADFTFLMKPYTLGDVLRKLQDLVNA